MHRAFEGERMSDELFSLRVVFVSTSAGTCDQFRLAAGAAPVPIDFIEADSAGTAAAVIGDEVDLALFDGALGDGAIRHLATAARECAKRPFTVLLSGAGTAARFETDALAGMPSTADEAIALLSRCIRVRVPSRVLVVDDSPTMRSIVRKILAATRFPLEITEAERGPQAIKLARLSRFHVAFVDQHLPGLTGLETIAAMAREHRHLTFALMTSTKDEAVETRANALGVAFLKKPFFLADTETVLRRSCGLRALNPQRI